MISVYLDYNATAPLLPEVIARMSDALAHPGNASSIHGEGRRARKMLEETRAALARQINAWPNEVIFTASGTEANNMALRGFADRRLLVSATEHSSVLKPAGEAARIPVLADGQIDMAALEAMLKDGSPALLSVMFANNETGVIQPIKQVAALAKQYGALLHCDAVQAFGKIPVDFTELGVDMMTLSAHKAGGPQGMGVLVLRNTLAIAPLIQGGGQELGRRAGTENIAAIAGLGALLETPPELAHLRGWLDALEAELEAMGAVIFGKESPRLPGTSLIAMPGAAAETQLMHFDLSGIAVSAGSACSSGRVSTSHVLLAMGIDEKLASSAVRISAGWKTQEKDLEAFAKAWKALYERIAKAQKAA